MNSDWTFLSNHGHVILFLSRNENITIREMAIQIKITERAVIKIISDLVDSGYVTINKNGRNNSYSIDTSKTLRHDLEKSCKIDRFIKIVSEAEAV